MALLKSQVKEILASPLNRETISKAVKNEQRLRFHIDTNMEPGDARNVYNEFINWVRDLLPKDKFHTFLHLLQFPIPTNELTEEIFVALEKVYDAKDAYEEYNFNSPEHRDDWLEYRDQVLEAGKFWRGKAWEKYKTQFNGFIVVDLKPEQLTSAPEPYFYFLPIAQVHDFSCTEKGDIEWIVFKQPGNQLAVFDDISYRIFQLNDDGEITGEPILETAHNLNLCPVSFFWGDTLKESQPALKKSVLSNQRAALDWLLFFQTSKKHLDLYAPYPIYSGYEQDCDYNNSENGDYCDGGFIRDAKGQYYVDRQMGAMKCPVCADKRLAGVGSFIEVPYPDQENGNADLRNPVQITTVDKDSLQYNVDECNRLSRQIKKAVIGADVDLPTDKAFNEDQVRASMEGRRNALLSLKKNLERIESWTDDIMCQLRYGEYYQSNTIDRGTDWYLHSSAELVKQYQDAKTAGASDYQLDMLQDQIIETENKNNPAGLHRSQVLKHLEPYRHQTRTEVLNMLDKGFGDKVLIAVKLNFSTFVLRFERENTDLIEFASALPFENKIKTINEILKSYGREQIIPGQQTGKPAEQPAA